MKLEKAPTPAEKYEAAAIELAVYRLMQREQWENNEAETAAAESMPRMLKMIDQQFSNKNRFKRILKTTVHVLKTAAIVVLILNMALTIAIAGNQEVRARFLELVMLSGDSYIDIRYHVSDTEIPIPADWKVSYFPSYVPEGYTLQQYVAEDNFGFLEFTNVEGKIISIDIDSPNAATILNTENAQVTQVPLQNVIATVLEQPYGMVDIVWSQGEYYFIVNASDYDTAFAVAMGIRLIWQSPYSVSN